MMSWMLSERDRRSEFMDDLSIGGAALLQAHRHLRLLNLLFAAAGPAVNGVHRLWRASGSPSQLTVADIGSGTGDVNRSLLRWADRHRVRLRIVLTDITAEACEEARALYRDETRVEVRQSDLFELPTACSDIVTASQFLHHFPSEELPYVIDRMLQASRLGAVIADIHRHPAAWAAVWLVTRLSTNRYIRHDGPLSVAKGFQAADWERLANRIGSAALQYRWHPMFRYSVTLRRMEGADTDGAGMRL